jgi:hypothetical protein
MSNSVITKSLEEALCVKALVELVESYHEYARINPNDSRYAILETLPSINDDNYEYGERNDFTENRFTVFSYHKFTAFQHRSFVNVFAYIHTVEYNGCWVYYLQNTRPIRTVEEFKLYEHKYVLCETPSEYEKRMVRNTKPFQDTYAEVLDHYNSSFDGRASI